MGAYLIVRKALVVARPLHAKACRPALQRRIGEAKEQVQVPPFCQRPMHRMVAAVRLEIHRTLTEQISVSDKIVWHAAGERNCGAHPTRSCWLSEDLLCFGHSTHAWSMDVTQDVRP